MDRSRVRFGRTLRLGTACAILCFTTTGCGRVALDVGAGVVAALAAEAAIAAEQARQDQRAVCDPRDGVLPPPGFIWADTDPSSQSLKWVPGRPHGKADNLVAAKRVQHWVPVDGQVWTDTQNREPRKLE